MQLFNNINIDFLDKGRPALMGSAVVIGIFILSLIFRGLNLGLDFTGGTVVEVGYPQSVEVSDVRRTLSEAGFENAQAQHFGTSLDVLIRIPPREGSNTAQVSSEIVAALQASGDVEMRRVEFVGPQFGRELVESGLLALLYALIGILVYIGLRFEWRLAGGAVAAVCHDVLFVLGFFSLFQIEFDLTVLAAVLAVIGYSVNDTVVVFDRIRENFLMMRQGTTQDVMNVSINQTMSRTVVTSLTTLFAVLALFIFGGPTISGFGFAMILGIIVGTYSSIFVASYSALWLGLKKEDLLPTPKEEFDDLP